MSINCSKTRNKGVSPNAVAFLPA